MSVAPSEERFAAIAGDLVAEAGVEAGTGFGRTPGLRVGGKIFAMVVHDRLVVKLPAERAAELTSGDGAEAFEIGKRRMREWVAIQPDAAHDWDSLAREALEFVR